ncbi:MAG TPA: antibiotic biosynthesis monooxygenase [Acidimicrobiales bacterium]|jgi:heme oxygenase (mycobilin-producing)|nr:antibiotic biosynthesis monooxygenase [Acidimicrobiales bacterium]
MSVVRINAITVPAERAEQLAARFAARAGQVETTDGFEEFQLLRPTDGRETWLVYTRWRDEAAFDAWVSSAAFGQGHAKPEGGGGPVASGAELWSFLVEQQASAPAG